MSLPSPNIPTAEEDEETTTEVYWMSKKCLPILSSKLLYKMGQDFLDRQNNNTFWCPVQHEFLPLEFSKNYIKYK